MDDLNIPIFAQAKIEYTKQLVETLYPHMYDGIKSIYDESKVLYASKTNTPIMLFFRELLEKVPIWNSEIIDAESARIIQSSGCDWIDDLITAVFISHTKILTSIGPNQSFQKINVTIPKTSSFVHKSYINVARELWKNPYLFNENVPGHEFQRNSKEVEDIIKACIETTVRNLLPIKEILREHLDTKENDTLLAQKEELKQMLREELQGLKGQYTTNDTTNDTTDEADKSESGPTIVKEDDNEEEDEEGDSELGEISTIIQELKEKVEAEKEKLSELDSPEQAREQISEEPKESNDIPIIETTEGHALVLPSRTDEPPEDVVKSQCNDIVVHDITLPVDVETGDSDLTPRGRPNEPEMKYDNVDVVPQDTSPTVDEGKIQTMQKMLVAGDKPQIKPTTEVNVIKDHNIKTKTDDIVREPTPSFTLSGLYPSLKPSPQPEPQPEPQPTSTPLVEISGDNPLDETSSLANFFNDMKQIVEDKGIKVETNQNHSINLFDDASVVEK